MDFEQFSLIGGHFTLVPFEVFNIINDFVEQLYESDRRKNICSTIAVCCKIYIHFNATNILDSYIDRFENTLSSYKNITKMILFNRHDGYNDNTNLLNQAQNVWDNYILYVNQYNYKYYSYEYLMPLTYFQINYKPEFAFNRQFIDTQIQNNVLFLISQFNLIEHNLPRNLNNINLHHNINRNWNNFHYINNR